MTEVEKMILSNQIIMMSVLNELLCAPGVCAVRGKCNYHTHLHNHMVATKEVIDKDRKGKRK